MTEKISKIIFRKSKENINEVDKMIEEDITTKSKKKYQFGKKIRTRTIFERGNTFYFKAFENGVIIKRKKLNSNAKKLSMKEQEPLVERGIYLNNSIAESFAEFIQVTNSARRMMENLTENED